MIFKTPLLTRLLTCPTANKISERYCPECLDSNLTNEEYKILKDISDNKDNPNWRATSDADYRLEAITDWIFGIEGDGDISDVIKDYFDENGYKHFEVPEEDEDEDDWDDW